MSTTTRDLYEYETRNGGERGSVKRTRRGYVVETHSRYQGTTTGERVHVPADLLPEYADADLNVADEHGETAGGQIVRWLDHVRDLGGSAVADRIRVLRRGVEVG